MKQTDLTQQTGPTDGGMIREEEVVRFAEVRRVPDRDGQTRPAIVVKDVRTEEAERRRGLTPDEREAEKVETVTDAPVDFGRDRTQAVRARELWRWTRPEDGSGTVTRKRGLLARGGFGLTKALASGDLQAEDLLAYARRKAERFGFDDWRAGFTEGPDETPGSVLALALASASALEGDVNAAKAVGSSDLLRLPRAEKARGYVAKLEAATAYRRGSRKRGKRTKVKVPACLQGLSVDLTEATEDGLSAGLLELVGGGRTTDGLTWTDAQQYIDPDAKAVLSRAVRREVKQQARQRGREVSLDTLTRRFAKDEALEEAFGEA